MRNLKRALASILAVAMLSTSVNVGFAATANFSDVDSKYTTAVTRLAGIDILTGYEDGTFKPEGTITRAEAAAVMVRMLGKEKLASYSAGVSQFSDMTSSHWANGYVNVAASAGLVKGYEDGTFGPEKQVTYAEIVTMMVRAIGAGEAVGASGTWPNNYLNFALTEGLTDDVAVVPNQPATRGDVAIMANQTLDTTMWEATGYNTDGTRTYAKAEDLTKTLFTEKLDLQKFEKYTITSSLMSTTVINGTTIQANAIDSTDNNQFTAIAKLSDLDDNNTDGDYKDAGDVGPTVYTFADGLTTPVYPGMEVDIFTNKDGDVVSIQPAKDSNQKVVDFADLTSISSKLKVKTADGTEKSYDCVSGAIKLTNGGTFVTDADYDLPGKAIINKEGKIQDIYTYNYNQAMVVDEVKYTEDTNKYTIKANTDVKNNKSSLSYDLDDDLVYVNTPTGQAITLADIKEGDMVLFSDDTDATYLMVYPANKVDGTVDGTDADALTIDGTDYDYSVNFETNSDVNDDVKVDDTVTAYLDPMGKVVTIEKVTGGSADGTGDYGIITDFYRDTTATKGRYATHINIFDLKSGVETGLKTFDAENTDSENDNVSGELLTGFDFYSDDTNLSGAIDAADEPEVAGLETSTIDPNAGTAGNGYTVLLGQVVKYDVDGDKTTIYSVDKDEITVSPTNSADYTKSKDKFAVDGTSYYVDAENVKVYQATELDVQDQTVAVKPVAYSTLKDLDNVYATVVDIDDDDNVSYVYFPLYVKDGDGKVNDKQDISKANSDSIGIITKVRELSGEDVEVSVMTKDGAQKFYIDKDEKDDVDNKLPATSIRGVSGIKFDTSDTEVLNELKGLLVSYSADADGYVSDENVDFSNEVKMAKYYETNSWGEIKLLDQNNQKATIDAYGDMLYAESDITATTPVKATSQAMTAGNLTANADVNGYVGNVNVTITVGNVPAASDIDASDDSSITITKTNNNILIAVLNDANDGEAGAGDDVCAAKTEADVAAAVEADATVKDIITLTGASGNAVAGTAALVDGLTATKFTFDSVAVSADSSIDVASSKNDTTWALAEADAANTIYYYVVSVDDDGAFVSIDEDATTFSDYDHNAIAAVVFDTEENFED